MNFQTFLENLVSTKKFRNVVPARSDGEKLPLGTCKAAM